MTGFTASFLALATAIGAFNAMALPLTTTPMSISVLSNHLVDGNGAAIQVHGVNRSGTEYACIQGWGIFDGPSDAASVQAIASWHVNMVRVPLNEDCWLGINGVNSAYGGTNYQNAIVNFVNLLHQNGMYAELTLMWSAPGTTKATYNPEMPDADHAPAAWQSIATVFKNDPAVIFGLVNEPHNVSWSCWLNGGSSCSLSFTAAGMQQLVTTIRNTGATQPITVSGIDYANTMGGWLTYEPSDPLHALIAEAHVYGKNACADPTCFNSTMLPVAKVVPMIWGEYGESYDATDCGSSVVSVNVPWAMANTVGAMAWVWDTWGNCEALISNYNGTNYGTGYAVWVQNYYAQLAANQGPGVSAISPNRGPAAGGTAVTITGSGFTGAMSVKFGTASATNVVVTSDSVITAVSPAGAGSVDVTVTTSKGTSATGSADQFTYIPLPVITGISPASGPAAGGTLVTITGSGFTGATAVKFGTATGTAMTVVSNTTITVLSPAGSGTVDVTVTTAGGTSVAVSADRFTYVAPCTGSWVCVQPINPTSTSRPFIPWWRR